MLVLTGITVYPKIIDWHADDDDDDDDDDEIHQNQGS